jgi:hypothetical protein
MRRIKYERMATDMALITLTDLRKLLAVAKIADAMCRCSQCGYGSKHNLYIAVDALNKPPMEKDECLKAL